MNRMAKLILPSAALVLGIVLFSAALAIIQPGADRIASAQSSTATPVPTGAPADTATASPSTAPTNTLTPVPGAGRVQSDIGVVGTGSVFAQPDTAVLNIGVEITAATLAAATKDASDRMNQVLAAIKGQGIDAKDIQTTNYSIFPITSNPKEGESPTITGYRVSNQVTVKVRAIDNAGKVLDAAIAAGANSVGNVFFTVDDPTKFENDARALAVKDAQAKAQTLATAAGVKVGRIIAITEATGGVRPFFKDSFAAAPAAAGGAGPIETGQNEISVSIEMHFEIAE